MPNLVKPPGEDQPGFDIVHRQAIEMGLSNTYNRKDFVDLVAEHDPRYRSGSRIATGRGTLRNAWREPSEGLITWSLGRRPIRLEKVEWTLAKSVRSTVYEGF